MLRRLVLFQTFLNFIFFLVEIAGQIGQRNGHRHHQAGIAWPNKGDVFLARLARN